ncbi:transcriptional regulator [Halocatena marina]|uniref:transcriptional regulator n=1 Tax=Halocatena marina TaxID=2934937 RepID=UPI00200D3F00|nr:transcriptional regulator [Halocatena marina]
MAQDREHNESGQFVPEYSDEDVLGVFETVDGPVILSSDVVEELGCALETARQKLISLHEEGRLGRRKAGGRSLWWLVEDSGGDSE